MNELNYDQQVFHVPGAITKDALWKFKVYRLALYIADVSWEDVVILGNTVGTHALADQLYRAVGSIGANISEGFSRFSARDRARFYEYALGSARESRDWYFKARHVLGEKTVEHRYQFLNQIIRLLISTIPNIPKVRNTVHEPTTLYDLSVDED